MTSRTTAYDEGYEDGYSLGATEGADGEAQDWTRSLAYLLDTLAAWGIADGHTIDERADVARILPVVGRDLHRLLGAPLDPSRLPDAVASELATSPLTESLETLHDAEYALVCGHGSAAAVERATRIALALGASVHSVRQVIEHARARADDACRSMGGSEVAA